jgi:signal transduction histidine kinase
MRLKQQLRTTTFLLTLRYMVLFFVSATILMAVINWAITDYIERRADESLLTAVRSFTALYRLGGLEAIAPLINSNQAVGSPDDELYLVADDRYQPVLGNLSAWPTLQATGEGWVAFAHQLPDGSIQAARGRVVALAPGGWLLVGRDVRALGALERVLDRAFVWVLGVTLVLALLGGLLMSNDVLRRVNAINKAARQIMAGDLTRRMPTTGTRDEFDALSNNLNAMLEQIESLMSSVRHMSDNVAHDLRTPLTRLRNRLENLRARASAADADAIDACLEDADSLLSTFASLLSIARIESGASGEAHQEVDLTALTRDACDLYQALAEDKNIELQCNATPGARILGDRNLVFQALTNLLDNAIKYTPPGGQVTAKATLAADHVLLTVADSGPGIPEGHLTQVLDRFYRVDESRSAPGAGLGLSLVNAIAARHRATLSLEDNRPGLRVSLTFPAAQAA